MKRLQVGYLVKDIFNEEITVDQILYATGRIPNTKDIGLNKLGIETGLKGEIVVDEYSKNQHRKYLCNW